MTTETDRHLRTSPEIGGMGHSVKRKEDPRFIQGQGEYIDDVNLPGQLWLDIVRSPYAHATIKSIDASEALKIPGVAAVVTGKDLEGYKLAWMPTLAGDMQMVLPVDTVMYQSQEVAAVIATSRYAAADGVAAVLVDYEPLPVIVDPHKAMEADAFVLRPDRGPDKQTNHIWHWESGRRGGRRCGHRGGRRDRLGGHLHPAHPRRLDRDVRLRRGLGPGPPAADASHDVAGAACHPDGHRARRRRRRPAHLRAQHPGQDPRHRWWLRRQGAGLSRLRPRRRGLVPDRQAGQVDRGSIGEPAGQFVRPRLPHPCRAGGDEGRQDHRPEGQDPGRPRLHGCRGRPVQVPGRPVQRHHGLVRLPGRVRRGRRRLHEQAARRRGLPLLVPGDRGRPRHRADGRHPGPRDRQGSGPAADGELHPARPVPVQDTDRLVVRLGQLRRRPPEGDGHHRLRRPAQGAGGEARARRAHGHRHQQLHRDRRGRAVA